MVRKCKRKSFISRILVDIASIIILSLLKLRYRIELVGLKEAIKGLNGSTEGVLFLPNHPAQIDPVILGTLLWKKFRVTPIMLDSYYYLPGVHLLMKLCGAIPLPVTAEFMNKWKKKRVNQVYQQISEGLVAGESFLIYPAGKLKGGGLEVIGGASLIHNILHAIPAPKIMLIRTTGLWGSLFSKAYTERSPDLVKIFARGAKILLKNGIFFAPKRHVRIEFVQAPADFPYQAPSRLEVNRYLEKWYNSPWPEKGEPMNLVSFAFWKNEVPTPMDKSEKKIEGDLAALPPKVREHVMAKIAEVCERNVSDIQESSSLATDLGMDSLDFMRISLFLEESYDVTGIPATELRTVKDILLAVAGQKKKPTSATKDDGKRVLLAEISRPSPHAPNGKTIQEAFLRVCQRMSSFHACSDATSGSLSYKKFKIAALILSKKIQQLPGNHIGILFPSSVGAYIVILATLLAKKVPVMLNWTVGIRGLDYAHDLLQLQTVITSQKFLESLENGDLGKIEDKFVFIENMKEAIHLKDKCRGWALSLLPAKLLLSSFKLNKISEEDTAVVLFTSGSESLPKAVPLSHHNILFDQSAAIEIIPLYKEDVFYGVLPPFHSFGFSVTGLLPILSGLNVVYSPDPTDNQRLAREIDRYGITMFCCAPSFMKAVFQAAKPEQLKSVRLFVAGAEKTPDELFAYVQNLGKNAKMIEGYGITECSPIVTANRPSETRKGIGKPLPGIEVCIISSESLEPLPNGEEGEICICGPNVFRGYLGIDKNPFITIFGKVWYRSGDRGYLDPEGNVILSGRLSRFIKIGGEMVSLGGLEEDLHQIAKNKNWANEEKAFALAVAVRERESTKPEIVLFSTVPLEKEQINQALREQGYGRLAKINEVKNIESIPVTGTGKIQYRLLEEMLSNAK
ncbi:MAG: AMP-binding protein [Chlamydiae bacterium]|nr:AMP-binding protein [Chlamydiota bacterium]